MWTAERPMFSASETFEACISRIKDANLRKRFVTVQPTISAAESDYESKAHARNLNLVLASGSVGGIVTKDEMIKLYDQRMAAKNGPGRPIYDQIKLLPKGDRCPFCDHRNISTLDHVLPKTLYPNLAVTPLNLVASCFECNKTKAAIAPRNADEVVLHPYFDNITTEQWLRAQVVCQTPCAIVFDVVSPKNWNEITSARVCRQFALLELAKLYSSEAARELANIRYNLQMHFDAGGAEAVRRELVRQAISRRANRLNSWQTAMYETIAHDSWFCNGGFR